MSDDRSIYLRPPINGIGIGDYTLHDFAAKWMMQQDDIAEIARHAAANAELRKQAPTASRIVMFGDSITEFWPYPHLDGFELINRGIAGQNSSQMLLRFQDDVVSLSANYVVILCGTNDLRAYVGHPASVAASALARISRNVTAMSDIAKANDIRVMLCALPPVGCDLQRVSRDTAAVQIINQWLGAFAAHRGYSFVDYFSALADERGHLPVELGEDGVHPNIAGYARMWPILSSTIEALAVAAQRSGD
jgi:lysophospholipase L1-like esterase